MKVSILIVEDNRDKAARLTQTVLDVPAVSKADVTVVSNVVDAKRKMMEQRYDLLLLDVQIPNRGGDVPTKDGGYRLWQTICKGGGYLRPAHVIGVTSYKETHKNLASTFEAESWLLIEYDIASAAWADQIREKVEHIVSLQMQAENASASLCDVLVITALDDPELAAVLRLPYNWSKKHRDELALSYSEGHFTRKDGSRGQIIAAAALQMGMPAAACLTMKMIQQFAPRLVIMAGIAAGLKSAKVGYGDILVADPSWDWGSGKYAVEEGARVFQPDPRPLRVDEELVNACRSVSVDEMALANVRDQWPGAKPSSALRLVVGPVASGAAVLADEAWVENIRKSSRKLIGIEMETYGVYYAAHHCPKPRPLVVSLKSVCDYADAEKDDRYQHYAAYTSAQALKLLITRFV